MDFFQAKKVFFKLIFNGKKVGRAKKTNLDYFEEKKWTICKKREYDSKESKYIY